MENGLTANDKATIVMAGLPETGKTTFLGAFYHVLESVGSEAITLHTLPNARRHLESVRERWLKAEAETRTSATSPIMNDLNLTIDDGRATIELRWPDLSGEYFEGIVQKRTVNRDVYSILEEATALLFFIHPGTVTKEPRISEVARITAIIDKDQSDNKSQQKPKKEAANDLTEWDPFMIPSEVQSIELLQIMLSSSFKSKISKVAVIVSAWDILKPTFRSPTEYLESAMPMLYQYLEANKDTLRINLYGVSALGGDPVDDKDQLLDEIDPINRIEVIDDKGVAPSNGILSPILWLLE